MPKRTPSKKEVALWRYEQISDALGVLSKRVRGELVSKICKVPVAWPSGESKKITRSTVYRWISAYEANGLDGLKPRFRKDLNEPRVEIPSLVIERALAILQEDEELSLTMVIVLLKHDPDLDLEKQGIRIAHSTLQRRLNAHPVYQRIKKSQRRSKHRRRFVARNPHEIWHVDAKGPVEVKLKDKTVLGIHVLTILDDATRAILAIFVALSPNLHAAVAVFRRAAQRWGLPDRLYADRASIFDSHAFRMGLAELGAHRIQMKPRNPEANGKIEAYHRVLARWFLKLLKQQEVIDLIHLQQLLEAWVDTVYQDHRHRGLKGTPRDALSDRVSERSVSTTRLFDAFKIERTKKAHPKTGEVDLGSLTYTVPEELRGQRLQFLIDPEPQIPPIVVDPSSKKHRTLKRASIRPEDLEDVAQQDVLRIGEGSLQRLLDRYRGKPRPNAEPGFGLPEIYQLLEKICGHPVPRTESEAALIQRTYRNVAPISKGPTESLITSIGNQLGTGRPIKTYLDEFTKRIQQQRNSES